MGNSLRLDWQERGESLALRLSRARAAISPD